MTLKTNTVGKNLVNTVKENTPLTNAFDNANSAYLADAISITDPGTSLFIMMAVPTNTIPNEMYTIIPITDFMAQNPGESSYILLHNLCHVTRYHGFDSEKCTPGCSTLCLPTHLVNLPLCTLTPLGIGLGGPTQLPQGLSHHVLLACSQTHQNWSNS